MCSRHRAELGFTLIETLVALAVFSLSVLALLNLSGENARTAARVHDQVLAGMVAENRAVEALLLPLPDLAMAGEGVEVVAGSPWRWRRTMADTSDPGIVRVDVEVLHPDGGQVLARLSMFRGRQ